VSDHFIIDGNGDIAIVKEPDIAPFPPEIGIEDIAIKDAHIDCQPEPPVQSDIEALTKAWNDMAQALGKVVTLQFTIITQAFTEAFAPLVDVFKNITRSWNIHHVRTLSKQTRAFLATIHKPAPIVVHIHRHKISVKCARIYARKYRSNA
jgi:hypothetical protein